MKKIEKGSIEELNKNLANPKSTIKWYSRKGRLLTDYNLIEKLLKNNKYKIVDRYENKRFLVSTVWVGLDQNLSKDRNIKIIFETAVFRKKRNLKELWIEVFSQLLKGKKPIKTSTFGRLIEQHGSPTEYHARKFHKICVDYYRFLNFSKNDGININFMLLFCIMMLLSVLIHVPYLWIASLSGWVVTFINSLINLNKIRKLNKNTKYD